jgi:predicted metal-dependent peptidase
MPLTIKQKVTKARMMLMRDFPFFGSLAMQLNVQENAALAGPTACTDGNAIYYNAEFFDGLSLSQLQFVLAHEAMHCAHLHHVRREEREPKKWNSACDYAINPLLKDRGLDMPPKALFDECWRDHSAEKVYAALPDGDGGGGDPTNPDPGGCGGVCDPKAQQDTEDGADGDSGAQDAQAQQPPTQQTVEEQERKWKRAVADAAQVEQKMAGSLPAGLEEWISDFLEPRRDWREELRDLLTRITKDDYSWRQPSRRFIMHGLYLPSQYSESAGHVVIAVDTSGSISSEMLAQFGGEIQSILEDVEPSKVSIIYCDTQINDVQTFDDTDALDDWSHSCKGRGGTLVAPVFDWIDDNDEDGPPDALVYLSDLYVGDFPEAEPEYPVIWACPVADNVAPIGDTVHLID